MKYAFAFSVAALLLSTQAFALPSNSLRRRGSHATRPSNYQDESNYGNEFDDYDASPSRYAPSHEGYDRRGGRQPAQSPRYDDYQDETYGAREASMDNNGYSPYEPAPAQDYANNAPAADNYAKSTTCTSSSANAYPTRVPTSTTTCTSGNVLPTSTTTCTSGKVLPTYAPDQGAEADQDVRPTCTPVTVTTTEVMPTTVYRTQVQTETAYKTNVVTTTVEKPVPQYLTKTQTVDHTSTVTNVATKTVDNYVTKTATVTTTSCTTKYQTATVTSTSTTTCYHTTTSVVEHVKTVTNVVTSTVKETAYSTVTQEKTVTTTVGALPDSTQKAQPDKEAGYGPVAPPAAALPDKNAGYGPAPSYDSGAAPAQDTKPAYDTGAAPSQDYKPTGDNAY
jgi:hypothetical protein